MLFVRSSRLETVVVEAPEAGAPLGMLGKAAMEAVAPVVVAVVDLMAKQNKEEEL